MTAINITANRDPISGKLKGSALSENITVAGSLAGLRLTIQNGLVDGGLLKIESSAHAFETPESFNYLGFGRGWLYTNPDGTHFRDVTVQTATGSQLWDYEGGVAGDNQRYIHTIDGLKYLRSMLWSSTGADESGGGMINWDSGRLTIPGDRLYMYSRSRCTVGTGTSENGDFQMKDERMGAYANLNVNVANSGYLKSYGGGGTLTTDKVHNPPAQAESGEEYFSRGINKKGAHYTQLWRWKVNTPDVADGGHYIFSKRDDVAGGVALKSSLLAPDHVQSLNPETPRFCKFQEYLGNRSGQSDVEWIHTDMYAQLNGSMFVIANNAALTSMTEYTPLILEQANSTGSWWMRLWKGKISSYTGTYIHLLDADLNSIASQQLG